MMRLALVIAAALAAAPLAASPAPLASDAVLFGVDPEPSPEGYVALFISRTGGFTIDPAKIHGRGRHEPRTIVRSRHRAGQRRR
jgi:hypothetical protein